MVPKELKVRMLTCVDSFWNSSFDYEIYWVSIHVTPYIVKAYLFSLAALLDLQRGVSILAAESFKNATA